MFSRSALQQFLSRTWLPISLMLHLAFALVVLLMPWGLERFELAGQPRSDPRLKFQQLEDMSQLVAKEVLRVNAAAKTPSDSPPVVVASDDRHFLAMLDYKLGSKSTELLDLDFKGVWYLPKSMASNQPARHHWSLQKDLRSQEGSWRVLYIYKQQELLARDESTPSQPILSPIKAYESQKVQLKLLDAPVELQKGLDALRLLEEPDSGIRATWVRLSVQADARSKPLSK